MPQEWFHHRHKEPLAPKKHSAAYWACVSCAVLLVVGGWGLSVRSQFSGAISEVRDGADTFSTAAGELKNGAAAGREEIKGAVKPLKDVVKSAAVVKEQEQHAIEAVAERLRTKVEAAQAQQVETEEEETEADVVVLEESTSTEEAESEKPSTIDQVEPEVETEDENPSETPPEETR